MTCKRPYTVSSQIQHGNDQEKYVQLSSQQQWKRNVSVLEKRQR